MSLWYRNATSDMVSHKLDCHKCHGRTSSLALKLFAYVDLKVSRIVLASMTVSVMGGEQASEEKATLSQHLNVGLGV